MGNQPLRFFSVKIDNAPFIVGKTKPSYSNFKAKEMNSLLLRLQKCQIIKKKMITAHAWWSRKKIIFLALKRTVMIKMHTKLTKFMRNQLRTIKMYKEICQEF